MKKLNLFHLNGLRAVETVARRGSLRDAADELGVSASAVSQQLTRTEAQLGRSLFRRTRDGFVATEFGARFVERLAAGFRAMEDAVALADAADQETLVVSVAPAFASRFLVPRMMGFFDIHPEILIRMDASVRLVDINRSDVDLAIRLGDGRWTDVHAEKLIDMDIFPVCSPTIAAGLKEINDLSKAFVISDASTMIDWNDWFKAAGVKPIQMHQGATFNDVMLCLDSVIANHGVMLGWQMLAGDALADGRLVAPFALRAETGLAHYFVTPKGVAEPPKVSLFKQWVRSEVEFATQCIAGRAEAAPSLADTATPASP